MKFQLILPPSKKSVDEGEMSETGILVSQKVQGLAHLSKVHIVNSRVLPVNDQMRKSGECKNANGVTGGKTFLGKRLENILASTLDFQREVTEPVLIVSLQLFWESSCCQCGMEKY